MKLKDKIKKWLFKEEIERINVLEKVYKERIETASYYYNKAEKENRYAKEKYNEAVEICDNLRKTVNDVCDVGIDIAFHEEYHNWAVICIHGSTEFVKFVPIKQADIHVIRNFLKQFEYCGERMRVDSPMGYREVCMPWISNRVFK